MFKINFNTFKFNKIATLSMKTKFFGGGIIVEDGILKLRKNLILHGVAPT